MSDLDLWYTAPAVEWTEALPVGNGRLGAMVFGGIDREHLQLNEDTLWTGGPYTPVNPRMRGPISTRSARRSSRATTPWPQILAEPLPDGEAAEADDATSPRAISGSRCAIRGPAADYRRALDLDTALATTTLTAGGITFTREVFASAADNVIVHAARGRASRPASPSSPR